LNEINRHKQQQKTNLEKSFSSTSSISVPAPSGLKYYNYQLAAIEYILNTKNTLLADEMGLGKTIEIIGYINYAHPNNALIIVPKSLILNWKYELERWIVHNYKIIIINSKNTNDIINNNNTIFITNYEKAEKIQQILNLHRNIIFDLLVLDESHFAKNYKAKRTRAILGYKLDGIWVSGLKEYAKKIILATGTPLINNLGELYTQLRILGSELSKQHPKKFIEKYIKDLPTLQKLLRQECMIRREKKDVLELPEKIRQLILLPKNILSTNTLLENEKVLAKIKESNAETYDELLKQLYSNPPLFEQISRLRHLIALDKLPLLFDFIDNILDNDNKIVIFAHHKDIIDSIHQRYENIAVYVDSDVSVEERNKRVMLFNNDNNIKIFIGSLRVASFGLNLTSASIVIFAELDWTAAIMHQAEDRCHRIGQENKLTIYIPIVENSIDEFIASKIYQKEYMSMHLLNRKVIL
jgi:SWI/SNF-related matrix-associated actin-dependent regulator 1 of chromatin subfamily A